MIKVTNRSSSNIDLNIKVWVSHLISVSFCAKLDSDNMFGLHITKIIISKKWY